MDKAFGLGHAELRNALREAHRRRRIWRRAKMVHKGLLEACVGFTRSGARIVDATVMKRLRVAFRELRIISRRLRILMDGEIEALRMLTGYKEKGVFRWIPQLETWLRDEAYKFWLGTMQTTLKDNVHLMIGVEAG